MDNFHYFGLFLDTNTKNKLMNILTDNIDYNIALNVADKIFIDHCTLLHVSQSHGYSEVFNDLNNRLENSQWFFERLFHFNTNTKTVDTSYCEQCGDTIITKSLTINIED